MGAALRVPRARRGRRGGYRVYSERTSRSCVARVVAYREPRPVGAAPRSSARAPLGGATDRPVDLRRDRLRRRAGAPAGLRKRDAARDLARDRGRGAGARRRAGRDRRVPARAQLPRGRAPLPAAGARRRRRRSCSPTSPGRGSADGEPAEVPIDTHDSLGHEWAVCRRARATRPACVGVGAPRSRARMPRRPTATGASRRCGRWTRASCGSAALARRSLARRAAPELAGRLERTLADRPLAVESPAPGADGADEPVVAYLDD